VSVRTVVALVRLRHQLVHTRGRVSQTLLVEEATALAWAGADGVPCAEGEDALALLRAAPAGDVPDHVRARQLTLALDQLRAHTPALADFARRRADALLADHVRVRESARTRGSDAVHALLPPDVIAVYVLLPNVQGGR
jgi:hypothetical protein